MKKSSFEKSRRTGDTGVGYNTEYDFGISESSFAGPDEEGKEIKTTRDYANSRITLFTKNPLPRGMNSKIKTDYGYYNDDWPSIQVLCPSSITPFEFTKYNKNEFGFKLVIDEEDENVAILVKNHLSGSIEEIFSYSFAILRSTIKKKILSFSRGKDR